MKSKLLFSIPLFLFSFFIQAQEPLKKLYQVGNKWYGQSGYKDQSDVCGNIKTDFYYKVEKDTVIDNLTYSKLQMNRTSWHCISTMVTKIELADIYIRQVGNTFLQFDPIEMKSDTFFVFHDLNINSKVSIRAGSISGLKYNSMLNTFIKSIDTVALENEKRLVYGLADTSNNRNEMRYYYIDGIGFFHTGADPRYGDSRWFESGSILGCFSNGVKSYSFEYSGNPYKPTKILNSTTLCKVPLSTSEVTEVDLDFITLKEYEFVTKKVADKIVVFDAMGKVVTTNENSKITSIQNLPKGIYIARFSFENGVKKYKFFKQ